MSFVSARVKSPPPTSNSVAPQPRTITWRIGLALGAVLLTLPYVLAVTFGYLAKYDDEGTLMTTFHDLMLGGRLYDDIYALYGPFYYVTVGNLFVLLHVPLTHDWARAVGAAFWVACTLLYASLVYRATASRFASALAFFLTLMILNLLPGSPTHPEELCLVLLAVVLHLMHRVDRTTSAMTLATLGALMVALLLTKINIGIFVVVGVGLVLSRVTSTMWMRRLLFACLVSAALAMPLALMMPLMRQTWVWHYWLFAMLTIGAAVLVWARVDAPELLQPRQWIVCIAGGVLVGVVTLGIVILQGSTPYGILNAVLLQNSHFIRNWYMVLWLTKIGSAAAAVSAAAALAFVVGSGRPASRAQAYDAVLWLKLAVGVVGVVLAIVTYATNPGAPELIFFRVLPPFCWLLVVPDAPGKAQVSIVRVAIGLVGACMVLYPFPVAGGQVADAALLPMLMVPILLHDAVLALSARSGARGTWMLARRVGAVSVAIVLALILGNQTRRALDEYSAGTPLALPGAALVRGRPTIVGNYRWLTQQLSQCGSFYAVPGLLSLNFWTGKPRVTRLNSNDPLGLFTSPQQLRIISDLSRHEDLCIVRQPELLKWFDRGQLATRPPLIAYIEDNFSVVATRGDFDVMRRKPTLPR